MRKWCEARQTQNRIQPLSKVSVATSLPSYTLAALTTFFMVSETIRTENIKKRFPDDDHVCKEQ